MDDERLRRAYEELARRVAEERLAFADRVQEVLDQAQHIQSELDSRDEQARRLEEDVAAERTRAEQLQARVEELHDELRAAHENHRALEESRSFRYTRPLRSLGDALRRR